MKKTDGVSIDCNTVKNYVHPVITILKMGYKCCGMPHNKMFHLGTLWKSRGEKSTCMTRFFKNMGALFVYRP